MALTPSMRQSLQLLGMSTYDLNEYIESALEKNPFLKKEHIPQTHTKKASELPNYADFIKGKENPREELVAQIRMRGGSDKLFKVAEYLIYEMDDNGYITAELADIAEDGEFGLDLVQEALGLIQELDPAGIGAQDPGECLQLQLRRSGMEDSLEYRIVSDFIGELAREDIDEIAGSLGEKKSAVEGALKRIKKLNPRPASNMLAQEAKKIIPDIIVDVKDGKLELFLNKNWLPQLAFHNPYEGEPDISEDKQASSFIKQNKESAKYIIDGLKRRENTLLKVAYHILDFQKEGISAHSHEIRPLGAKDVSDALGMHKTTITRTISNKYILLYNRVCPLKDFLSRAYKHTNGERTSTSSIKAKIARLIKGEDLKKPLSDQKVKEILDQEGISLTRRVIAKYRGSLKILPTHLRRRKS